MNARLVCAAVLALSTSALAGGSRFMGLAEKGKDLFVTLQTTQGDIVLKLFSKDAPLTVSNFVGLAAGEKEFVDPKTQQRVKRPFYDGLKFHRVIEGFMIQGGDPEGTGRGGPGFTFGDEFKSGRTFDKVGLLAMANRGPDTNGSQFFITTSTPQHLNNHHTIFGEVLKGYDVVETISRTRDVVITRVTVTDKAPGAAGGKKK